MSSLRRVYIRRSLIRPILLCGAERELVIMNMTLACALIFGVGIHKYTCISAAILLSLGHVILLRLAKIDPLMSKIYLRQLHYQDFYPAKSSHLAHSTQISPSIKL